MRKFDGAVLILHMNISNREKIAKNKKGDIMKKRIKDYRYDNIQKTVLVQYEGGGLGEIPIDVTKLNVRLEDIKGLTLKQAKLLLGARQ